MYSLLDLETFVLSGTHSVHEERKEKKKTVESMMPVLNIRVLHSQNHFLINIFSYFETNTWSMCIVSRYYDQESQFRVHFRTTGKLV
jgi:hypothetical protein